ncbi:MAG TPA: hypothetical protein VEC43_04470 [Candidatus Acidoferrales bacterium]|nr:hypothetical protein [Candidatus Acidoferrales bacterium]
MIETVDEIVSDVDEIEVDVTLSGWGCRFNTILPGPLMVRVVGLDVAEQVNPPVQVQLRKL